MIDIHTHILNNVDDGSNSLEESIMMLKKLQNEGVTDVIMTPHFIEDTIYGVDNNLKQKKFDLIKEELNKNNLKINIYLGNEVYMNDHILKHLDKNIKTLNDSRYLLIEESLDEEYIDVDIILKELIDNNIIPIIAHPERYNYFIEDNTKIDKYLKLGVLFQGNYSSLNNKHGEKAKKLLTKMLKKKEITFLSSDMHQSKNQVDLEDINKKLKKIVKDDKYIYDLLYGNAQKVLKNELI